MKLIVIFFITICFNVTAKVYAQKVSLNESNTSLDAVFKKIKNQTDYTFVFTKELLEKANAVNLVITDAPLDDALQQIFATQPLSYTIYNNTVIIKDKSVTVGAEDQDIYSISGTVSDEKGNPLPGATVFLSNTQKITPTNEEGKFLLGGLPAGTYELVVKMLGFKVYTAPLIIQNTPQYLQIKLTENAIALDTVNIKSMSIADRRYYLRLFKQFFIGESVNAEKCTLLNPDVVNLNFNDKAMVLEATTDDFLILANRALGYNLHYLITEFKLDMLKGVLTYDGSLYFENLEGTKLQEDEWQKNRQFTYEGSMDHFFKAAFNNTLKQEGFLLYRYYNEDRLKEKNHRIDPRYLSPINDTDSLLTTVNKNFKLFPLNVLKKDSTELYVIYTGKDEPYEYTRAHRSIIAPFKIPRTLARNKQTSILHPLLDSVLINQNGSISPAKAIFRSGYWAWQRAAEFLPPDYKTLNKTPAAIASTMGVKTIVSAIDTIRRRLPIEKLHLHLDKPYYIIGDTLRFKAYLFRSDFLTPSFKSGLLYIQLDDAGGKTIKTIMVPLVEGVSWGDIALDERDIPQGSYTIRAYTNWMRNFGEDYVFKKNIYVSAINGSALIKADFKLAKQSDKYNIQSTIRFTGLNKEPLRLKDMSFRVMDGKRALFKNKATTGMDGSINIGFDLPDNTAIKNLSIQAQQITKAADEAPILTIPVTISRAENTDLQFMPEGGDMVVGIKSKIGFKAISEDGKGIPVSGRIYNSKQQQVAIFKSTHAGMGCFDLRPVPQETYTAKIVSPEGINKTFTLPIAKEAGTALKVIHLGSDSLQITVAKTPDLTAGPASKTYYLLAQARGLICYAGIINFSEEPFIKRAIASNLFPTGITRFTLMSATNQPLNERVVYIDHHDNLQVNLTANKQSYSTRDSIALNLLVTDKAGKPVQGTFSLAVTDNSQVRVDSIGSNIINDLLMTADLKGTIEEPGYYFENNTPQAKTDLDNLMLTQGWVGYDWKQVFTPALPKPAYPAEAEFTVTGKVTNLFNKPVKGTSVVLFSKNPLIVTDTVTDKDGNFVFKGLFPVDTAMFKLQAKNKNNKSTNVGITANEFKAPTFSTMPPVKPWYVNSDTLLINNGNTKIAQQKAQANYTGEGNLLKEVAIKDKKTVKDSKNLNGTGEADFILDEKDIGKMTHLSLKDLLAKSFKNFQKISRDYYLLNNRYVALVIDGVFVQQYGLSVDMYMDMLVAEDIKGIEVIQTPKYAVAYNPRIIYLLTRYSDRYVPLYLEITTRSGNGAFMNNTPGTYLYKTLPFSLPTKFYRPKYTANNSGIALGTDLRSTIHWEPNVITNAEGKATITFYSADNPTGYTVILEGTDLNGGLGYKRQKINVTSTTVPVK
jgi:hypothetical protein